MPLEGFERIDLGDGDYFYAHRINADIEVALEPLTFGRWYFAVYWKRILIGHKTMIRIDRGAILQVSQEEEE